MIKIKAAIIHTFKELLPGYIITGRKRHDCPYYLRITDDGSYREPFGYYVIIFNYPDDHYPTFRLYFIEDMTYVYCLYFERYPTKRKRRIYQKNQTAVFQLVQESGWDSLTEWLLERQEKMQ